MWKMISYEACGRGHEKENIPCQDKALIKKNKDMYIIALADGAGSCKKSHYGASIVIDYAAKIIEENFDFLINNNNGVEVKKKIVEYLIMKLQDESLKLNCTVKELSSTLLLACIKKDKFLLMHIGDGVIGGIRNGKIEVLSTPFNGEYSNSTVFVTSKKASEYMKIYRGNVAEFESFVLMSDGTCESLYNKREKKLSEGVIKIATCLALFKEDKVKKSLEESFENLILKKTLDDCSIALIVKKSYGKKVYKAIKKEEKINILGLKGKNGKFKSKKLYEYEEILEISNKTPLSQKEICEKISLKNRYLRKEIKALEKVGLITFKNKKYYSNINL